MDDPFVTRMNLILGNSTPYTDDPGGYDPTDALAVYSLPKLDPAVNNSNAPQDQSAALLDPSAFQPPADLGILGPVTPPGAAIFKTPDGTPFYAPAGTDFNTVYRAGQPVQNMISPLDQFRAIKNNIAHSGQYDFQRKSGSHPEYAHASNFAVGAFMNGAGYSWPETDLVGTLYGELFDKNGLPPDDEAWWRTGYDAAANGQLPKKGSP